VPSRAGDEATVPAAPSKKTNAAANTRNAIAALPASA
jgi:hypothetical protein